MTRLPAVALAAALLLTACGDDGDSAATDEGKQRQGKGDRSVAAAAAEGAAVEIISPEAGATVPPTFVIRVRTPKLKLGDSGNRGALLGAYVDREPARGVAARPKDEGVFRSTNNRVRVRDLPPGEHTITIVALNQRAVPFEPMIMASLKVNVDPNAAPQAPQEPSSEEPSSEEPASEEPEG